MPPHPEPSGSRARPWAEPHTEAAQCLASMSSSTSTSNPVGHLEIDAPAEPARSEPARMPGSKPARLSLACNPCRRRKVRCDARQPKCHNCTVRQDVCITSDLRRPGAPLATRRRSTRRNTASAVSDSEPSTLNDEQSLLDRQIVAEATAPLPNSSNSATATLYYHHTRPSADNALDSISNNNAVPHNDTSARSYPQSYAHVPAQQEAVPDMGSARTEGSSAPSSRNAPRSRRGQGHGPEKITWLSRAYHEISMAQGRGGAELEEEDHDAATPDIVVHTDGSLNKLKVLGGSSFACLFKFADLWLAGYGCDATAPLLRHGLCQSEEFNLPLAFLLPDLPHVSLLSRCIDAYVDRIWPLFPIISGETLRSDADDLLKLQNTTPGSLQSKLPSSRIPNLAILYAVICIGLNEKEKDFSATEQEIPTDMRPSYLTACYSLQSHLTAAPYHTSVQALLLLALGLRACSKDGQSWYVSGQAARMALSLGLHKSIRSLPSKSDLSAQQRNQLNDMDESRRHLWGSCFSLEMLLQLETGRTSSISSSHLFGTTYSDRGTPVPGDEGLETDGEEEMTFFSAWVSLASIMGQISDRLYSQPRFTQAMDMLGQTSRLARSLSAWEALLPETLKPQNQSGNNHLLAVFLAQQFHHAQIAVCRTAIVFPHRDFQSHVEFHSQQDPEIKRLLGSAALCVSASRNLIIQALQVADAGVQSVLIAIPQILLASIVLALSILRAPTSRLARLDGELLTSATSHVEGCYQALGYPPAFLAILSRLRERAGAVLRGELQLRPKPIPNGDRLHESEDIRRAGDAYGSSYGNRDMQQGLSRPQAGVPLDYENRPQYVMSSGVANLGSGEDIGLDAFNMEFGDLWNMLDADMLVYNTGD